MLTSGLVSLNVHEALTFEGTEICLHPDLFTQGNDGSTVASASVRGGPQTNRLSLTPATSFDNTTTNNKLLKEGDMIEIRVWDPLTRASTATLGTANNNSSNATSFLKPQPRNSALSPSVSQQSLASEPSQPFREGQEETALVPEATTAIEESPSRDIDASTASPDHHSITDVQVTQQESPDGLNSEDNFQTKTAITGGDLPPVFPRSRSNTSDTVNQQQQQQQQRKPPINRRPLEPSGATKPNLASRTSSHIRELSDMTLDTVYSVETAKTTVIDGSNQLVDVQIPTNLSSEDEDDFWTQLSTTHTLRLSFVLLVTEKSLSSIKGSARTQVSLLRQVADLYGLSSYDMVTVHKIEKDEEAVVLQAVSADFVTVTIKDQFVSRGDMQYFQSELIGTWIYEGQRLNETSRGIQAHAREIRHSDRHARSGIVTENTMITYRSRSARIFWLVQMSVEMFDYASPYDKGNEEGICQIYFDIFIKFVYELFARWKIVEATHSLTIVFFSRTFVGSGTVGKKTTNKSGGSAEQKDVYGRNYEDHYRMVVENETRVDWESLLKRIKEAFVQYPRELRWNLASGEDSRRPSTANQGNVLEAINVTLNVLQFHYLDRDLHRTGNSVVVVSAGNGVFEVDKGLASITYQRMMDNGIGSDMLSLSLPPLHIAPFFLYVNDSRSMDMNEDNGGEAYYEIPHWMHLSFVSYESDESLIGANRDKTEDSILPSEEMFEVGANCFILPSMTDAKWSSQPVEKKSFSVHGNAAASPVKLKAATQARQLIAGRDFRDILEACRPRHTGMVPSALKSLIELHALNEKNRRNVANDDKDEEATEETPTEWGTFDLRTTPDPAVLVNRRRVSIGEEKDYGASPCFTPMLSPPRVDEADSLLRGNHLSPSSSHSSSYPSSGILGISYDRLFLNQPSPSRIGVQMQRSPSIDIELDEEDSQSLLSEETLSSVDHDSPHENPDKDAILRSTGELRQIMKIYDKNVLVPKDPPKLVPGDVNRSNNYHVADADHLGRSTTGVQQMSSTGGIGAALTQYRTSSSGSSSFISTDDVPSIRRTRSLVRMGASPQERMIQRGLSPMLPPHVAVHSVDATESFGQTSSFANDRVPLQRRFLPPGDYSQIQRPDSFVLQRGRERSVRSHLSDNRRSRTDTVTESPGRRQQTGGHSSSPPTYGVKSRKTDSRSIPMSRSSAGKEPTQPTRGKSGYGSRRKKAFNPFREQDEEEVLAKKSHNRRRWSHVFPLGEIEFKRHAGPIWKSLATPAILPLSIDYFPPQQEIDHNFTFSIYNITLNEFEHPVYSSNKELLMEMVRQRITQDFQLVLPSQVNASNYQRESLRTARRSADASEENPETIRMFLSMGHRLQVLTYDADSDTVEVTRYNSKSAQQNTAGNSFNYFYYGYCQLTGRYKKITQTFNKYADQYNWNKVDRIISGDEDKEMREGMRFRRIMFALIPEKFQDIEAEKAHTAKFLRLLEYLNKLRDKEASQETLDVKVVSSEDKVGVGAHQITSTPGLNQDSMKKFYVQLRKGKNDVHEWIEVAVDCTFDTAWTYRIMFSWLVASSGKVDNQIQMLQRRCTQYGLNLIPVPQLSVSRNPYLNPFKAPSVFTVHDKTKADLVENAIANMDFIHDGVFYTDALTVAQCIDGGDAFDFGKRWTVPPGGRQLLHRSGTLFVRIMNDRKGWALIVVFENYIHTNKDREKLRPRADEAFFSLVQCIHSVLGKSGKGE